MRIQQQLHSSPWNIRAISELPIVLKSSVTKNTPRRNPSLRTCFPVGVSRAVTLTIGLPALAMINGFPPAASSTKRDSCVLALWMLTVITTPPLIELSSVSLVQNGLFVKNRLIVCLDHSRNATMLTTVTLQKGRPHESDSFRRHQHASAGREWKTSQANGQSPWMDT